MKACKGEDKNARANVWGHLYNFKGKPLKVTNRNTPYIVLKHNIPRVFNYARGNARRISSIFFPKSGTYKIK